ncbi:MAG TPA: aminotransferase class V-fold PLP-dependent enzyme [Candidatus Pullilachnospira intestinigallinarum]|nr:aminotransferase class V-fold PLP-dependent enzyme [Candidatus Pullilachnospira intestinigallinarum]
MDQNRTPLLDAVAEYAAGEPAYFKIPAHRFERGISPRWRKWTGDGIFRFDLTEAEGLDDLHGAQGVIRQAQELAADLYGARKTYFLVNGTTCGNEAMILAACREGEKILVPRNAHKSVLMGLILSGAHPVYLMPPRQEESGLFGGITPRQVEEGFRQHPDCRSVFLVSPTYYGILSDIRGIARVCHEHDALLLVDEAHGAHLYFGGGLPRGAISEGADLCVQSTHKVAGSLTQSSMLHVGSDRVDPGRLESCLHMVQSTSPSYLLMVSLDAARYELARNGTGMMERACRMAQKARRAICRIPGMHCWGEEILGDAVPALDPTRLVITARQLGISGYQLADLLYEEYQVGMELADDSRVVAVVTWANTGEEMNRLTAALEDISRRYRDSVRGALSDAQPHPTLPPYVLSPRKAFFAPKKSIPWREAVGKIAGESLIPYPPGIPLVYPGERISPEIWEYMERYRSAGLHFHGPADRNLSEFQIIPEEIL